MLGHATEVTVVEECADLSTLPLEVLLRASADKLKGRVSKETDSSGPARAILEGIIRY